MIRRSGCCAHLWSDEKMREKIFEIPVGEIMEPKEGCPICRLRKKLEKKAVDYILGPAMMEPDIRQMTNRRGFCGRHLDAMLAAGNRLPFALTLESLVDFIELPDSFKKPLPPQGCFVCDMVERSFNGVLDTVVLMFHTDPGFREVLLAQESFCLPHHRSLCEIAQKRLKKEELRRFIAMVSEVTERRRREVHRLLSAFTTSFDYRNAGGGPLPEEVRLAVERAVDFLSSERE